MHTRALVKKRLILVPAPVLAQVWRGGGRQVELSKLLKGCVIAPTTEQTARAAGVLLGTSGTCDAVDAIVVATALPLGAQVCTSDVDDLSKLARSANAALTLIPV
jgi:PIN domain